MSYEPIAGSGTSGQVLQNRVPAPAQWATVTGTGSATTQLSWDSITGKPSTFPPSTHTHSAADITTGLLSLSRITPGSDGQVIKTVGGVATWSTDSEGGAGSGAPTDAAYFVATSNTTLTNERVLSATSGITLATGSSTATLTMNAHSHASTDITGLPATWPPSTHAHVSTDITDFAAAAARDAAYFVASSNATLTNERVLSASSGLELATGASTATLTLSGHNHASTDITDFAAAAARDAAYFVASSNGTLTNERVLSASSGIALATGSSTATLTLNAHTHGSTDITDLAAATARDASYLVLASNTTLTNERTLTAGSGISFTDNGAGSTLVITNTGGSGGGSDLTLTVVPPLSYATSASIGTISTSLWSWSDTTVNVNATTTETNLVAFNIPPNLLTNGRMLRVTVVGQYQNNTGANRTNTMRVYYGGSANYADATLNIGTSATVRAMYNEVLLRTTSSTSRQVLTGQWLMSGADAPTTGLAGGLGAAQLYAVPFVALPTTDSTSTQSFRITIAHSVNSSTISTTVYGWTAELI